jgi:hypothetical protein
MYITRNSVARSRIVYTSSAIRIPCYHFTSRESFYGDLMSPATIEVLGLHIKGSTFLPVLTKFGISQQILLKVPNIIFHVNSSPGSRADTGGLECGRTDWHDKGNTHFSHLTTGHSQCLQIQLSRITDSTNAPSSSKCTPFSSFNETAKFTKCDGTVTL